MLCNMTLLITNDDGIEAPGIAHLTLAMSGIDTVFVAAPLKNCSAIGHAITIDRDICVKSFSPKHGAQQRLGVDGTPADAVKYALKHHWHTLPDLVVSGINAGPNVGYNVHYSGTVGAAFEALFHGVSSVAVSCGDFAEPEYRTAVYFAEKVVRLALKMEKERLAGNALPPFCLNLNVPSMPIEQVKGLIFTRHGTSGFDEFFVPQNGDDDNKRFRIDGIMKIRDQSTEFGGNALDAGYASVTPLKLDLTDYRLLDKLLNQGNGSNPDETAIGDRFGVRPAQS